MKVTLFACSQSSSIDVRTSMISVFHLIEELNSPAFPVVVPTLSVIAIVTREDGEREDSEVKIHVDLGEIRLFQGPFSISFQHHLRARAVAEISGLVILSPGNLRVGLYKDGEQLSEWVIKINNIGQATIQTPLA